MNPHLPSETSTTETATNGVSAHPSALPLFADAPAPTDQRRGRVRGSFTLAGTPSNTADEAPAPPVGLHPVTPPAPQEDDPVGGWRASGGIDWETVATLRQQTADRLSAETSTLLEDREGQRDRGRVIIGDLLSRESTERARAGAQAWTAGEQDQLARAVFDAVFGLGRLQPLVDDEEVDNVLIFGYDRVVVELAGGTLIPGPPVADSDEELIDFLTFVATRSEVNARPFSPAQPALHLRLDGGARLAATAWVTPRPQVVIRRHRLADVSLDDLVGLAALSPVAASFLAAAVKGHRSIVVSGGQGAGKTTLVRALCGQIPKHEVIGTFETEYELHLHDMIDRHPMCFSWEARPGSGERSADGKQAGEYTLVDALYDSFRYNLTRQIVGEVRGPEAKAMLKAMQSSHGSISTTHATNATGAIEKLATCVMEAGSHDHDYAVRAVSAGIKIVVHVNSDVDTGRDRSVRVHRYVSEIIAVSPGEKEKGYATTHVFRARPGERVARPHVLPEEFRGLAAAGFDIAAFYDQTEDVA